MFVLKICDDALKQMSDVCLIVKTSPLSNISKKLLTSSIVYVLLST